MRLGDKKRASKPDWSQSTFFASPFFTHILYTLVKCREKEAFDPRCGGLPGCEGTGGDDLAHELVGLRFEDGDVPVRPETSLSLLRFLDATV